MGKSLLRSTMPDQQELQRLLDRDFALRSALEQLNDGRNVAWIAEPDDGGELVLRQVCGDYSGLLRGLHVSRGHGLTGKVFDSEQPAWVDDYFGSSEITHTFDRQVDAEGVRRLLAVPVLRGGNVFGVLALGSRDTGAFGSRAIERVNSVADDLALAVAVAERTQLAREVAVHQERSRIAADLHDNVGAILFAIGSGVAGLAEFANGDPDLLSRLERLGQQAAEASTALRESVRTLHSSPTALALAVALRADCVAFADRTGTSAVLVLLDDLPAISSSRTDIVSHAVREALLNVEKHAGASAVVVTVSRGLPDGRDGTVVAVTDDGVGLGSEHCVGMGLTSTAHAVSRLGGVLRVASEPQDGGTLWRMELPC
ncbi:GAF domain-containing protein [Streptomyces phaeochromogenes]|uniref:GAF domain-containing sensor histidine kinase n=1 Tax=Streptomyces phaeochromogenes TaxID=1923 RepID=UPI0033CCFDE4